jgi:hypothetical protein
MKHSGRNQIEWTDGLTVLRVLSNGNPCYATLFKTWVTKQFLRSGVSLAGVALANGLNTNVVRTWVAQHKLLNGLPGTGRLPAGAGRSLCDAPHTVTDNNADRDGWTDRAGTPWRG